jgi:hypothetical protein
LSEESHLVYLGSDFDFSLENDRTKPPTRIEVQIALGLAAALLYFVVILNAALSDISSFDLAGFYTGGLIVRLGNTSRLYDLDEQARMERQVFNRKDLLIFTHPPFETLLFRHSPGCHT